jgi:outer membrane protein assembly factor BamB
MRTALSISISSLSLLIALGAQAGSDWPQWRGPDGTGHVPASAAKPGQLPRDAKPLWKIKVGEGLASPVVAGGRLFYFDAQDGKEVLRAVDARTTEPLWKATIDATFSDSQGPAGPRATPTVDGERIYAVSCRGELQCLNVKDGTLIWRTNYSDFGAVFVGERGNTPGAARHGNNGSPLIHGDRLYAPVGGPGAGVVCFNKHSGEVIWKSTDEQAAYAPPVLATLAGVEQVVCFMSDALIGLRAADGELLWRVLMKTAYGRHVTTPVVWEDIVVVGSHQVGLVATRIVKEGDTVRAEEVWTKKDLAMNFSSPVLVGKYLYGLGPKRDVICVEVPTGEKMWSQEGLLQTSADKAFASFLVMGGNILMLTDIGELILFRADPAGYQENSRLQVCGVNWCNPAFADGRIFVRDGIKTTGELACIDLMIP